MNDNHLPQPNTKTQQTPLSFWVSIGLIIIFVFVIVILFGLLVYLFIGGAQQMGVATPVYIAIFVAISGIFAWLIKRLSDVVSGMSHYWFPEDVTSNSDVSVSNTPEADALASDGPD